MNSTLPLITVFTLDLDDIDEMQLQTILLQYSIETLIDIRANPQATEASDFDEQQLRSAVSQCNIEYHWAGRQLGGQRTPASESRHTALSGQRQTYADYMDSDEFKKSSQQLISFATRTQLAIVCASDDPDNCYRDLLSDYLVLNNVDVKHICPDSEVQVHTLSSSARTESLELIYDRK